MEQAPLISIIMPVYNAGVLLHTAVESVLRQSFADFELLLVDDGSTDGSAALAHELAKKDGRIRVLEQPNAGICAARNLGLQHCRGQWFTFCDDDDTMLPHALETLLVLAKSTGADVVRGGYRLLRANAAGTAVELPLPPGQAIIIHKPAGQGYLQFCSKAGRSCLSGTLCTVQIGWAICVLMKPAAKGWKILPSTRRCSSRQIQPHIRRRSYMNTWSGRAVPPPVGTRQQCRYGCNTCPGGCRRNIPQPAPGAPRSSCQRCGAPARQSLSPLSCISCGMAACRPKPKRLPGAACSRRWQPAPQQA